MTIDWRKLIVWISTGLLYASPALCLPPFQLFVEITPPGGVLQPDPGVYAGPVVIKRPITIEGGGEVTIDGGGEGTVMTVKADGTRVRGLRLVNSGHSHDALDAAIRVQADQVLIEENRIEEVNFGIVLEQAHENVIRQNRIGSRSNEVSMRGEGIRLWYSSENLIEGNRIERVRDILFINSPENRIIDNRISDSRIGMEFVFSPYNEVIGNTIERNTNGIVGLYSDELVIRGNRLLHMRAITGSAVAIKESSQVVLEENTILHCAVGLIINAPVHPENITYMERNLLAYNDVAMYFYGEKGGHRIHDNHFSNNLTQVAVSAATSALFNDWRGNHWEDYQGFDRDGDGFGDTPHALYLYSDRIWMDRPMTRFFRSSPVLELIDFTERLAPFLSPPMILRDPAPRIGTPGGDAASSTGVSASNQVDP